jgi:hypothetical protein
MDNADNWIHNLVGTSTIHRSNVPISQIEKDNEKYRLHDKDISLYEHYLRQDQSDMEGDYMYMRNCMVTASPYIKDYLDSNNIRPVIWDDCDLSSKQQTPDLRLYGNIIYAAFAFIFFFFFFFFLFLIWFFLLSQVMKYLLVIKELLLTLTRMHSILALIVRNIIQN